MKTTKFKLFNAFANGLPFHTFRVINAIEREDGSNTRYNVTGINAQGMTQTTFIQTTD